MIRIQDISFSIEGKPLLANASVTIPTGHKVGIVGRNGTGKTTLFHLITGKYTLDSGEIELGRKLRIGGVSQEVPSNDVTLIDTVLANDTERTALLAEAEQVTDPDRIALVHERLASIDAYSAEARAATILNGLGFDTKAQSRTCAEFSGGWRMRVALAGVLFAQPDILLLDEPTNYLDLEGTVWLETYLAKYPHTVLVISHDRTLLNKSVNSILHLHEKKLTFYQGNYDQFDKARREKLAQQSANAKKQERARAHLQSFVDRFRAKATKAKQAQSRLKMLERMEPIAASVENSVAGFNFPSPEELSPPILRLDGCDVGYDGGAVLKHLNLRIDQQDRIALLGANGQGKSTLSKLLSDRLAPLEGEVIRSRKLRIGYFAQHQVDELMLDETPLQHMQRELPGTPPAQLRSKLANGGLGAEQADVRVGKLSGGQKARLSMLLATLDAPHLLILDEPTNHLDIESREALALSLAEYNGAVILVSHDPHLVNAIADQLWLVKDGAVRPFPDDLEAYKSLLLSQRAQSSETKKERPQKNNRLSGAERRKRLAALKDEVTKCEDRIAKLEDMAGKVSAMLADPEFYAKESTARIQEITQKHGEIKLAMEKAEDLWMTAQEALEEARNGA